MKPINLLAAAVALVMGATPAFASNWVYAAETDANTVIYYDADTVQRSGNQVTVWEKWDHSRDKYEKRRQRIIQNRYDCSERTKTLLNGASYYPNGKIDTYNFKTYEQEADSIVPDSISEATLEAVCR